jgi:two-component system LytT family response regulator
MSIKTLIVDDEPLARERIALLLESEPDIEIVGECGDGKSAARAIKNKAPDLVFLDIQLPEMDGFELIGSMPAGRTPAIIFVTAYDQFAVKAFKVHAVDYLLKPVEGVRLRQALEHFRRQRRNGNKGLEGRLAELISDLQAQAGRAGRMVLRADGETVVVRPGEIDWVESAGNYVCFHVGADTHVVRETLNQAEERFRDHNFARIHRSTIVNLDRIKRLKPILFGDYSVELRNGAKLKMSRSYSDRVFRRFDGQG